MRYTHVIALAGSRDYQGGFQRGDTLRDIYSSIVPSDARALAIHGDCTGYDRWAANVLRAFAKVPAICVSERAGPLRNRYIADLLCLARGSGSKVHLIYDAEGGHGTYNMVKECSIRGIPVHPQNR